MNNLLYKNYQNSDQIFVEDLPISEIAKEVGTPFYCYSKKSLIENYQKFDFDQRRHRRRLAAVGIDAAQKLRQLRRVRHCGVVLDLRRSEGAAPKGFGRIRVSPACGDGVSEDLPAVLHGAVGRLHGTATLDPA